MRILVTGALGFVGRNLHSYLAARGHEIVTLDTAGGDINCDITNPDLVFGTIAARSFDSIVHLAAVTDIKKTIQDPHTCYRVNVYGTLNILELAAKRGSAPFIYVSTPNVYGPTPRELPVRETAPFSPRAPYDYSKVVGEYLVNSYALHREVKTAILRPWKLFGPNDNPGTAISRFITAALDGDSISLYNGGRDTTDPTYIDNFSRFVELCLAYNGPWGEAFNVGTGVERSIREVAETVVRKIGSKSKLHEMPPRTPLEAQPMRTYPSIEKAHKMLGYEPIVDFEEGLDRAIQWYKARLKS